MGGQEVAAGGQEQQQEQDASHDSSSGSEYSDEYESEEDEEESCDSLGGKQPIPQQLPPRQPAPSWVPDYTFKVLLVGDSGVGKTCLVMRFISDKFEDKLPSTVGVDFAIKKMQLHDLNIKVTIWDTAGQERFRALTSTFYRGAKGIIFVYDVTRRETLASLSDSWMAELDRYQPHPDVVRMVVANKVDKSDVREVTWQEGADFAKQYGCLFVETSAKQNIAVGVAFEELVLRILETPSLLGPDDDVELGAADRSGVLDLSQQQQGRGGPASSCSC